MGGDAPLPSRSSPAAIRRAILISASTGLLPRSPLNDSAGLEPGIASVAVTSRQAFHVAVIGDRLRRQVARASRSAASSNSMYRSRAGARGWRARRCRTRRLEEPLREGAPLSFASRWRSSACPHSASSSLGPNARESAARTRRPPGGWREGQGSQAVGRGSRTRTGRCVKSSPRSRPQHAWLEGEAEALVVTVAAVDLLQVLRPRAVSYPVDSEAHDISWVVRLCAPHIPLFHGEAGGTVTVRAKMCRATDVLQSGECSDPTEHTTAINLTDSNEYPERWSSAVVLRSPRLPATQPTSRVSDGSPSHHPR